MNGATLLYRQIHPTFVQLGRVTSQAFRPTEKDEFQLSAYDGDMIDAEPSWVHYTTQLGYGSCGVLAVAVGECVGLDLRVEPAPDTFPEHVLVDFRAHNGSQMEKRSKKLRGCAERRGWMYQPPQE